MAIKLNEHFTFKKILKITIFPIFMMVFTSLYSIVDGIFIANFASESSFAAVNLIFPFLMIIGSLGFMFGTGGSALVSKYLGEGNKQKASKTFSLIIYSAAIVGLVISIIGVFLIEPIVKAMASLSPNTTEGMVKEAIKYGRILCSTQVFFILQNTFQPFFLVNEKPKTGFLFVLGGGLSNIVFDALFIGVWQFGVVGAAFATTIGYLVASIGPFFYFIFKKDNNITLGKTEVVYKDIFQSMYNGISEFVGNIAMSLVSIIYNAVLLKEYGANGVSAYGIIMYVSFVFMAIFIGYSIGIAPVISFNYGAKNHHELKNVFLKSLIIIGSTSLVMFILAYFASKPFASIFSSGDEALLALSTTAMKIFSFTFLFCGLSIFFSSFFTALNNGTISMVISLSRTLLFQISFAFLFPILFGANGIWWAMTGGEICCLIVALIFILTKRNKYHYY